MSLNVGQILFNFCQPKILAVFIDLIEILVWPVVQNFEKTKEIIHFHFMIGFLYFNKVAYSMLYKISQLRLEVCEKLKLTVAIN
jgi:hypothetical protein